MFHSMKSLYGGLIFAGVTWYLLHLQGIIGYKLTIILLGVTVFSLYTLTLYLLVDAHKSNSLAEFVSFLRHRWLALTLFLFSIAVLILLLLHP